MDIRTPRSLGSDGVYKWPEPENTANPKHITTDFNSDDGLFVEENGLHRRVIENGEMTLSGDKYGHLAYIHVYDSNVTMKTRFMYTDPAPSDAYVSFVLRYSSPEAYVRVSYYNKSRSWALMFSEGKDMPLYRITENKNAPINPGEWHDVEFTLDQKNAKFYLDGKLIIETDLVDHVTPGRIAVCATNLTMKIKDFDAALLSDQGTVWQNCIHNKLPDEEYREGGTVLEMGDRTLRYIHKTGVTFDSKDNGVKWDRREKWTDTYGYPNILRLRNGDFIKILCREVNGASYMGCQLSSDDGATWRDGGNICLNPYKGNTSAIAVNMNDKVTQISSGRIFYCQNYESLPWGTEVDGRTVFCEFYYSDDMGMTWQKSETDSWSFGGNNKNDVKWFGECKILECDDGSLRIYNSWNDYGCIVYSESFDGGKTWGELVEMPEFVCARSSMQFYRDQYADNETTYYMVWVYSPMMGKSNPMSRSRLSLARSTNGKDWEFLGDIWRWECRHMSGSHICHIVDSFVMTNETHVICGAGFSEHTEADPLRESYHHAQRQHLYSIPKSELKATALTRV